MESWYFLIRVVGLLKSKCHQHFPTPPQLASPQIKFKVAFTSSPQPGTHCSGLSNMDGNKHGWKRLCRSVWWVRGWCVHVCICVCESVSICECMWMTQFIWYMSRGALGCQFLFWQISYWEPKGGRKVLRLLLLWLRCSQSDYSDIKIRPLGHCGTVLIVGLLGKCGRFLLILRDGYVKSPPLWSF